MVEAIQNVLVVLVLALTHGVRSEEQMTEDSTLYLATELPEETERNLLLGTFVKFGGGLLSIAGQLAKHTGNLLHASASLVNGGGDALARIGVNLGHGGLVLDSAGRAVEHGGDLLNTDQSFMDRTTRGLVCALVCPIRPEFERERCRSENCDFNQVNPRVSKRVFQENQTMISERVDEHEHQGLLEMGAHLLTVATNILTDIAFVKIRLLQGLFSRPDCWISPRNNDNGCISQLCNYTEQRPKIYYDFRGECTGSEDFIASDKVIVDTVNGPVIGQIEEDYDFRFKTKISWNSFTGIPYAAPPVGDYRFMAPVRPNRWTCPLDATKKRNAICPQLNFGLDNDGLLHGSNEDCLYLNVYVPRERNTTGLLPVAVWLHGGAFMFGSGSACWFGPQFWMVHEVILVTLNYRLGPLGFLSLGNEEIPGNAGMLDQVAALEWVRDNIHRFGGASDKVTLMGQSAGSFSTTYHLVSPKSRGLFKRIIAQSGVGGFSPSYHHYSEWQAVKYGNEASALVGCLDPVTRVQCLKSKKVSEVMTMDIRNELLSQPVVDGPFSRDPFLPADPKTLMREGKYNSDIEILLGFNEEEGHMVTSIFEAFPLLYSAMAAGWPILGPFSLLGKHHTELSENDVNIVNRILLEYVGNVSSIKAENIDKITNMFTDSFFSYGISKFLDLYLPKSKTKTYQYIFSYKEHSRASHSSELPLLWGVFKGRQQISSSGEKRMSRILTSMWTNFMKFGNPTPRPIEKVKWKPSTEKKREYLLIGKNIKMEASSSLLSRLSIWKAVLNDYK